MKSETTLIGHLKASMGIGGETTGWTLALEKPVRLNDRQIRSIELESAGPGGPDLSKLQEKRVQAEGVFALRSGVERGTWVVLAVRKVAELPPPNVAQFPKPPPETCRGTYFAWREDGDVVVFASGVHSTGGFSVELIRVAATTRFRIVHTAGEPAAQVVTGFTTSLRFTPAGTVNSVTVEDRDGQHEVPVRANNLIPMSGAFLDCI